MNLNFEFEFLNLVDSPIIDEPVLEVVVKECSHQESESEQVFSVINAFAVPRFEYSRDRKKFFSYVFIYILHFFIFLI